MGNTTPVFPGSARTESIKLTSAATRLQTPTNKLFTAGSSGSRVEKIECIPTQNTGSSSSKLLRVYIKSGGGYYLYHEIEIQGVTSIGFSNQYSPCIIYFNGGLTLGPNQEVWVSQSVYSTAGDVLAVTIHAKDF